MFGNCVEHFITDETHKNNSSENDIESFIYSNTTQNLLDLGC